MNEYQEDEEYYDIYLYQDEPDTDMERNECSCIAGCNYCLCVEY